MVTETKERWQIALITAFTFLILSFTFDWVKGRVVKVSEAATKDYVDTKDGELNQKIENKHKEAIQYTDSEIEKRAKTEQAYREGMQIQINNIEKNTNVIYNWVLQQQKIAEK